MNCGINENKKQSSDQAIKLNRKIKNNNNNNNDDSCNLVRACTEFTDAINRICGQTNGVFQSEEEKKKKE